MNWEQIKTEYEQSSKDLTLKALAEKHGVKLGTLKSRKSREKWIREKDATKSQKDATPKIEPVIENEKLTEKQKMFCLYYFQYRFNATKAYQEAYDSTYHTARTEASRLLAKPSIKEELNHLKAKLQQDTYITIQDLINEYIKQAFADITDFVAFDSEHEKVMEEVGIDSESGEPLLEERNRVRSRVWFKPSDEVDGSLIQEVKQGREGISVKLHDKQKAMQELAKYIIPEDGQEEKVIFMDPTEVMKRYIEKQGETDGG